MRDPRPQRVFVTGCASGIGRRLVGALAARGHRVTASDVDREALERAARDDGWDSAQVRLATLDVTRADAWRQRLDEAIAAGDGLDVVINVAGVLRTGPLKGARTADVDAMVDVNLKGVAHGTRLAAARMTEQGHGHIVNVASLASLAPVPGLALYAATKYAVRALSLAAAEELRPAGIAVTTVCPDAVDTPMLDQQVDDPAAALTFTATRVLTVDDVAHAVLHKALPKRPLLVVLPRHRGWLARFADLFPGSQRWLAPILARQGLKRQAAYRDRRR